LVYCPLVCCQLGPLLLLLLLLLLLSCNRTLLLLPGVRRGVGHGPGEAGDAARS
jgi:hypothetical protein